MESAIAWELLVQNGSKIPVPTVLYWDKANPLQIKVTFDTGEASVEWIFARDILDDAIHSFTEEWQGSGDVLARTVMDNLELKLTSPFGTATFSTRTWDVLSFLHKTYEATPRGKEEIQIPDTMEGWL